MNVLDGKIKLVSRRKKLKMTSWYEEELQSLDPLLTVSGAENLNLKLEDIYMLIWN